jgi:hypothetical protein
MSAGGFVLIYKALLGAGRLLHLLAGLKVHTPPGTPAAAWHALLAGWVGGWLIWAHHSSVNEQIAMYLLSRVVVGICRLLAKKAVPPFNGVKYSQVYPFFAAGVWALVMWIYETNPDVLQPSLTASMKYLYNDSNTWERGRETFLPTAASAAVVGRQDILSILFCRVAFMRGIIFCSSLPLLHYFRYSSADFAGFLQHVVAKQVGPCATSGSLEENLRLPCCMSEHS